MKQRRHADQGFTLLEIIVVLAVLGALAGILSPVFFRYIDDANRARAQGDANTIAAAIQQMYKDTGRWPFYVGNDDGAVAFAYDTDDATALSSDADCDGTANGASDQTNSCATNTPSGGTGWVFTRTDSLTRHLITNSTATGPDYTATGPRAWRGPYLDRVPPTDPWGRSYVVNIDGAPNDTTPIVVMVLSAGPDGVIDTAGDTAATGANPEAGDDDIIARVR